MSEQAEIVRNRRRIFAAPGSAHDKVVHVLQIVLPALLGALFAILALAPFAGNNEVSFVLDKDKVQVAKERLRVVEALYRGEDNRGRPFSLRAGSAVQQTSAEPVVRMQDLSARILLSDGPAVFLADRGSYDLEKEVVEIDGPIQVRAAGGYRLTTRDVDLFLDQRRLVSQGPVAGSTNVGTFRGDRLRADLADRTVMLEGNAQLRIDQNVIR